MKKLLFSFFALTIFITPSVAKSGSSESTPLANYIQAIKEGMNLIPTERKLEIEKLATYVKNQIQSNQPVNLVFICTHNSRRSQMSQIWASVAIEQFQLVGKINTYSGGTETTAFNPRAVAALERAGISIDKPTGSNPHYQVKYSEKQPTIECFSKVYTNSFNPQKNFVAVMNCSDADKNCPNVVGASFRTAIKYDDPKLSDGTQEEQSTYDTRCRQIATEMFYLMSKIK
jgi:protein-tyrosine-phosphatase